MHRLGLFELFNILRTNLWCNFLI